MQRLLGEWIPSLSPSFVGTNRYLLPSAYGEFEASEDCSDLTCASFLNKAGKKTPLLLRVSTVGPESGSADTTRDVHGWAMKMYTDEGNLDWVFNNSVRYFSSKLMQKS